MLSIRRAKKEDIRRIDEIYVDGSIREGKLQFPKVSVREMKNELDKYKVSRPRGFLREMNSRRHYWVVAEADGYVVGFGHAMVKSKELGRIEKIYVDRDWTRKGIGLKLLRELEKWLKLKGVAFIEAGIYWNNKPSIRLNEKAGYKPISLTMRKKVR